MTPARRKALQRQRDRAAGWREITVRVAAGREDEVRDFAATLPGPEAPTDERQTDLIERIEREMAGCDASQPGDLFGEAG